MVKMAVFYDSGEAGLQSGRTPIKLLSPTDRRTDKKTPPHLWALNFKKVDFCRSLQALFFEFEATF